MVRARLTSRLFPRLRKRRSSARGGSRRGAGPAPSLSRTRPPERSPLPPLGLSRQRETHSRRSTGDRVRRGGGSRCGTGPAPSLRRTRPRSFAGCPERKAPRVSPPGFAKSVRGARPATARGLSARKTQQLTLNQCTLDPPQHPPSTRSEAALVRRAPAAQGARVRTKADRCGRARARSSQNARKFGVGAVVNPPPNPPPPSQVTQVQVSWRYGRTNASFARKPKSDSNDGLGMSSGQKKTYSPYSSWHSVPRDKRAAPESGPLSRSIAHGM